MKSIILVSVLCTIALARPDGYQHASDIEKEQHLSGHQQNRWSAPIDTNEIGEGFKPEHSSFSQAPSAATNTHTTPSASAGK